MHITLEQKTQIDRIKSLHAQGNANEATALLAPLVELEVPEALLIQVDLFIEKNPVLGLDYLRDLASKRVKGANYKTAFLSYFHPETGIAFQPYLYAAVAEEDTSAILITANLYFQQNEPEKAYSVLSFHSHLPAIHEALIALDMSFDIVHLSHFNDIKRPDLTQLSYELIAREINLYTVDNFLSDFECYWLIKQAKLLIKPSMVVDGKSGESLVSKIRTGSVAQFKPTIEDWVLLNIEMKIAAYFNLAIENGELSNVLKYLPSEEYKPHYDFFHPKDPGSELALKDGGQRFKTVLIYLNEVEDGGETYFPRLKKSIKPKAKQLLIFNNTDNKLSPLPLSLHQGMKVKSGEKWLFSKWIRAKKTSYSQILRSINIL